MGFTANQWAILALVLILGWLLGLLSRSGGARWRRSYEEERVARQRAESRLSAADARIATLEREVAGHTVVPGTAGAIGAAASGARDDLALIRGIGRERETRLNEIGIHSYRQVATMSDGEAADIEARLGLKAGTIAYEEWREQSAMLRDRKLDEHRTRYAPV
jgi:predicted flap endonuclease-1-like 5' DNA nuclease